MTTRLPTVLFESGLLSGPYSWSWVVARMDEARFNTVLVDRSASSLFDAILREQTYTAVRDRLRTTVNVDALEAPVIVVGHSVGGMLALAHAHYLGSIVAGIVLVDPSPPDQFMPGVDTNYGHLRLNQAILRRALQAALGKRPADEELIGVRQLPREIAADVEMRMRRSKFWVDAYRESRAAGQHWVEAGFAPLHSDIVTAVVSSNATRVETSLQSRHVGDLLRRSIISREFRSDDANHESIILNEQYSRLVNEAIEWVAEMHSVSSAKAEVES